MGLLDTVSDSFDESLSRITAPFTNRGKTSAEIRAAIERDDFRIGFEILEYDKSGKPLKAEEVILAGDSRPFQPFQYGGEQKVVKDYYPGQSEPVINILGNREKDVTIRGRFKAKNLKGRDAGEVEAFRKYAEEIQLQIDAIRIRGNLVRIKMGEWQRWGFISATDFNMKTLADIDYEITFAIVGFNPPSDVKILGDEYTTSETQINKDLIRQVTNYNIGTFGESAGIRKDIFETISDGVSTVASAVTQVTSFVDNVLNTADNIKNSAQRALGLIKNARAKISEFQRRVGSFDPKGGSQLQNGSRVNTAYLNAITIQTSIAQTYAFSTLLRQLEAQIRKIALTQPLARHRVQFGDNLQRIAQKYYNDSAKWTLIFDHNKLVTTELTIGAVLEIPRDT